MDCSSPDIGHGCAGILNISIGKGDQLGVFPGSVQGALCPTESPVDAPGWCAIKVLRNVVGLLHQSQGILDGLFGVEGCQVYCLRVGLHNRPIVHGLLAMRDLLLSCSLEKLLWDPIDHALHDLGVPNLERILIMFAQLYHKGIKTAIVRGPKVMDLVNGLLFKVICLLHDGR